MVDERESSRPRPFKVDARYAKAEIVNPKDWLTIKADFPDVIARYSIPLTRVVERKKDLGDYPARKTVNLIDLIDKAVIPADPKSPHSQFAASIGLSRTGVFSLTEAAVALVSQETRTPLPHAQGKGIVKEMARIKRIVERSDRLRTYLTGGRTTGLEGQVISLFLEGEATPTIARRLNQEMRLNPPINVDSIWNILRQAEGRVNYNRLSRLTERSNKAKDALGKEGQGEWKNVKAQTTEQVLYLLSLGYPRDIITQEVGISRNQYSALISEAFREVRSNQQLWQGFRREVIDSKIMSEARFETMNRNSLNLAAQYLIDPYRIYRQHLGETVIDGNLSAIRLSSRERAILEAVVRGASDSQLATMFSLNRSYIQHIADMLSGYQDVSKSVSERLQERQTIYQLFKTDIEFGNIAQTKQQIHGVPILIILKELAEGKQVQPVLDSIFDQTGKRIKVTTFYEAYVKLRARYNTK